MLRSYRARTAHDGEGNSTADYVVVVLKGMHAGPQMAAAGERADNDDHWTRGDDSDAGSDEDGGLAVVVVAAVAGVPHTMIVVRWATKRDDEEDGHDGPDGVDAGGDSNKHEARAGCDAELTRLSALNTNGSDRTGSIHADGASVGDDGGTLRMSGRAQD